MVFPPSSFPRMGKAPTRPTGPAVAYFPTAAQIASGLSSRSDFLNVSDSSTDTIVVGRDKQ